MSSPVKEPGKVLAKVLEPMAPFDRAEFLQYLERKAKGEQDFVTLRAIRDYQAMASSPTSTMKPSTD
ncbi:hypothetical protein N8D56_05060 [Devosia sp. A8/3-2]|nr:hypothetical protein N8D56_05060 [Devosia sp. A8/3-2]